MKQPTLRLLPQAPILEAGTILLVGIFGVSGACAIISLASFLRDSRCLVPLLRSLFAISAFRVARKKPKTRYYY